MVRIRAAVFADISGIAAMVESYWHLEAIGGFERRSVESTLAALLSYPKHGAGWVADNEGTLCGYLTAVLQIHRGNERGRAFYERLGFRRRADYELFDKPLSG